jgi:hypothetical protein
MRSASSNCIDGVAQNEQSAHEFLEAEAEWLRNDYGLAHIGSSGDA